MGKHVNMFHEHTKDTLVSYFPCSFLYDFIPLHLSRVTFHFEILMTFGMEKLEYLKKEKKEVRR